MRCFIALELPPSARRELESCAACVRRALTEKLARLEQKNRARISWARPEGYHLTLAFLGEIEGKTIDAAAEALGAVASSGRISFAFNGLGSFPPRGPWRVLFAQIDDKGMGAHVYRLLNESLAAKARALGLPCLNHEWPNGRPYQAHVTIARSSGGPAFSLQRPSAISMQAGSGKVSQPAGSDPASPWEITRCVLYKSELQRGGSVYTELKAVDL